MRLKHGSRWWVLKGICSASVQSIHTHSSPLNHLSLPLLSLHPTLAHSNPAPHSLHGSTDIRSSVSIPNALDEEETPLAHAKSGRVPHTHCKQISRQGWRQQRGYQLRSWSNLPLSPISVTVRSFPVSLPINGVTLYFQNEICEHKRIYKTSLH